MEMIKKATHSKPVLTQVENNTTFWIGHLLADPDDHIAGQTFQCPANGELDNIQVLSSIVHIPGKLTLTLHDFDPVKKNWGPAIRTSTLILEKDYDSKWIQFAMQPLTLIKDKTYAFRLQTPDALIAIGEAASVTTRPFSYGQEWTGSSADLKGHYFTYFSLAFKVEMRA
jgi:hypothetical protein